MASQREEEAALVDDDHDTQDAHDARELLTEPNEGLPPRDRGAAAWRFVLGCALLEGLIWGLALSFGIFQAFYSRHPLFSDSPNIAVIGTCATAMAYFGMLFLAPVVRRYPWSRLPMLWTGCSICAVSLLMASFATRIWHLVLTQGLLYGAGWALCYTPIITMLNEWFSKLRGLAYGIVFGSTGFSALWLPFVLEKSLEAHGFRITLRILALMITMVGLPATLLLRPREKKNSLRRSDVRTGCSSILKNKTFMLFAVAVFSQALGFFLPRFFLPSFAHDASLSRHQGALLLALFGFAQVVGQLIFGYVSDMVNINILTLLSTSMSAISALTLWGMAKSMTPLAIFPLLYGSFGGSYSVLWSRILMYLTDDDSTFTTMFAVFSACRGAGNILSGPIASAVLKDEINIEDYGLNKYSNMVFFVGATMLVSSVSSISYLWENKIEEARLEEKCAIDEEQTREDQEIYARELAPLNRERRSQEDE